LILDLGKDKPKKRIFIETPENPKINAIKMELSLFIDAIIHDKPCEVSAVDGHKALKLANQIMKKVSTSVNHHFILKDFGKQGVDVYRKLLHLNSQK